MIPRKKKRLWHGLVGGIGVVAFLGGTIGGWSDLGTTITLTFGIWIIGTLLVDLLTD